MIRGNPAIGLLSSFLTVLFASHLFAQAEVIEQRQKLMKSNSEATKAIKAAAEAKDYTAIETKAKDIITNGDKVLDIFRKEATQGKTKAKPEIWQKWDQFSKYPGNVKKAATEVADAARAKNDEMISVKVKELGEACASCHKVFRAEKYAE